MTRDEITRGALIAFHEDAATQPPLTLRGGDSVDSYRVPEPYDEVADKPTDDYIARFAYFALPHLDALSWRHALPSLIAYVLRCESEPSGLIATAVIASMTVPDRDPPRLATLTAAQRSIVVEFLKEMSRSEHTYICEAAGQALPYWMALD